MAEDRIDSFINREAVKKEFADTIAETEALQQSVVDLAKEIIGLNNAIGKSNGTKDFATSSENASISIDKLQKKVEQQRLTEIRLQQQREKNIDDYNKKIAQQEAAIAKAQAAEEKRTAKALSDSQKRQSQDDKETQKQLANEVKIARQREKDAQAYNTLIANRDQAVKKAQNIGATFGTDSDLFAEASKDAEKYQTEVVKINESLGNYKENVGNYGSAFGKAFGAIRTAANILPGIGISGIFLAAFEAAKTLFDLIGNQGTTVFEKQNELIRKANDLYAQQASSVNLLVAEVKAGNTTQERTQEIIENLNKISPTYFGNIKTETDLINKLPDAYAKYNSALLLTSRIQAGQQLYQEKYKEILKLQQDILDANDPNNTKYKGGGLDELLDAIDQLGLPAKQQKIGDLQKSLSYLTSQVIGDSKKLQDNGGDIAGEQIAIQERIGNASIELNKLALQTTIDFNNKIADNDSKSYVSRFSALKTSAAAQTDLQRLTQAQQLNDITLTADAIQVIERRGETDRLKIQSDLLEKQKQLRDKESKQILDNLKKDLQFQQEAAKRTIDDPSSSLDKRLSALDTYKSKSEEILRATYKEQLKDAGSNGLSIKSAEKDLRDGLLKIQIDYGAQADKILKDEYDKQIKGAQEHDTKLTSALKAASSNRVQDIIENASDATNSLMLQRSQGLISERAYQEQLLNIQHDSALDQIDEQLNTLKIIIDAKKAAGQDTAADEEAYSKLTKARSTENFKFQSSNLKSELDQRKEFYAKLIDFANEAAKAIQSAIDNSYQARIAALSKESDAIAANADVEKAAVERSLLTSKQKADKEAVIDAQTKARQEQIVKEQNKLKRQQAVIDKAFSVANIIENTAVAITKVLAEGGVFATPLVALVATLGAIQLATVLATPLPAYKDGVRNAPGGLSLYGEAGTELVIEPGKKGYLTDGATIGNIPKGTDIISNRELVAAMANPGKPSFITNQLNLAGLIEEGRSNTNRLEKAFSNQTSHYTTITREGFRQGVKRGAKFQAYLNKNL